MMRRALLILHLLIVVSILIFSQAASASELRVLTSIKPVHSLVAAVMAGVGKPDLLIKGANSPHNFSLKPSDARTISQADIIFWIGKDIEVSLTRPLKTLAPTAAVVELAQTPELDLLASRTNGTTQKDPTQTRGNRGIDPHFWLNPDNAKVMVDEIVRKLSLSDNKNASRYRANGAALIARLKALDAELIEKLKPVRTVPFIVFHDAFQYFEKHFALNALGSITLNPDRAPGARKIIRIRGKIIAENVTCVFAEPQFKPAIVKTVIRNTSARMATLDPLGIDIPAGPDAYFLLLRSIADALVSCLGKQG